MVVLQERDFRYSQARTSYIAQFCRFWSTKTWKTFFISPEFTDYRFYLQAVLVTLYLKPILLLKDAL